MIIGMPSVRHTGTRVVRGMFYGFKQMHPEQKCFGDGIYSRHIGEKYEHEANQEILVIPLRRIDRIIVSWERREKSLDELDERLYRLVTYYDPKRPFYIPIDSDDRNTYWLRMCEELKISIVPQWQVISEKDSIFAGFSDIIDKDKGKTLIDKYRRFFSRFYSAADFTGVPQRETAAG